MPENSYIQTVQSKEIQRLEEEIRHISKILHQKKELLNKHFEKQYLQEEPKTVDYYRDQCEDIKKKIELTAKLNGICIEELNCKKLKAGDLVQYTIIGNCYDTRFRVEFECVENNNENEERLEITKLDIFVPENVQEELQKVLIRLSQDRSIWAFFQLLVPYCKWYKHRMDTFQYFEIKYPDYAELAEESFIPYLIIRNKKHKHSPVFCVSWKFNCDQVYRIEPKLSVGVKIPDYIVKQDMDHILDQTPGSFENMVEKLGIEHSIESLIVLVAT